MSYFKPHPRFLFNGANEFRELLNKMGSTISINEKTPQFLLLII
tara:strand:- start:679 stop:810 length:132 start_codon:yes stop_codon:yes gene_type:complete